MEQNDPTMPYIYLNNTMLLAKYFDKRSNIKKQPWAYFHIGYPPDVFSIQCRTGFSTIYWVLYGHGPSPLKKSTYQKLWELEPELLSDVCSHPFRHREDVSQYVLREYQKLRRICSGECTENMRIL